MCLILDTNRFGDAFSTPPREAYVPLLLWLSDPDGDGTLVFGGKKYRREIDRHDKARRFFVDRVRAGRALPIDDKIVDAEEDRLRSAEVCASDDEHVVALARMSGARVLCTEDTALFLDVKNQALLDKPRGRLYRTKKHAHLLHHDTSCHRPPSQKTAAKKNKRRRA